MEASLAQAERLLALNRPADAVAAVLAEPLWSWTEESSPIALTALQYDPWLAPLRTDARIQIIITQGMAWRDSLRRRDIGSGTVSPTAAAPAADAKSVAVLAFADMSPQKDAEYFSDGISEELLNVLAKIPGLKVTARTSAFHFKGRDTRSGCSNVRRRCRRTPCPVRSVVRRTCWPGRAIFARRSRFSMPCRKSCAMHLCSITGIAVRFVRERGM
jgi:hypothetical protein